MARNRKRAKDRRPRPPSGGSGSRPVVTARGGREENGAPPPMEHATPDVELAEAQLALGRPELAGDQSPEEIAALVEQEEREDELGGGGLGLGAPDELEEDFGDDEEPDAAGGRGGRKGGRHGEPGESGESGESGELTPAGAHAPARALPGGRLVNFIRGCWHELQRVQWPDRRQVVQATGVVIGFVIVAGLFLGGADWVSQKLVTFLLK